jgi:hypothetical protein
MLTIVRLSLSTGGTSAGPSGANNIAPPLSTHYLHSEHTTHGPSSIMPVIPSIQIGDAPAISLNTPEPQYHTQAYAPYPQPLAPQANQSMGQPSVPHLQNVKAQDQQRSMSIEMMDVGGLSLTSPEPVYGFKPELAAAAANAAELTASSGTPSPQPQGRQPSAEEARLKDKVVEAQAQVSHTTGSGACHIKLTFVALPIRLLKLRKPCNTLLSKPE